MLSIMVAMRRTCSLRLLKYSRHHTLHVLNNVDSVVLSPSGSHRLHGCDESERHKRSMGSMGYVELGF